MIDEKKGTTVKRSYYRGQHGVEDLVFSVKSFQNLSRLPSGVEVISEQESFVLKDDASSDPVIKVDKQTADGRDRPQGDNGALLGST